MRRGSGRVGLSPAQKMKRTRSPSPPLTSHRRKLTNSQSQADQPQVDQSQVAACEAPVRKGIKALEGLELHPLLASASSTALTSTATATSTVEKENPFLAHWNLSTKEKKKKFNERIPHVDKNLAVEPSAHRPRPLKFNAPGKFIAKAEAERAAAQIRQLEREIAEATEELGSSLDVAVIGDILRAEEEEPVDFEWWDVPFLRFYDAERELDNARKLEPERKLEQFSLAHDLLGNLIQRPSLKATKSKEDEPVTLKIYLTAEERKKLRRQRRLEAQKEVQEKIALGLLAAPPAKVKLSSLPRMLAQPGNSLGDESVQDPTRIAADIRAQSAARLEAHHQSNAERKLSEEERSLKKYKKFAEFDAKEVHVAVFKLNDRLEDGAKRFKVLINAEQNHLQGRSLTTPNFTLIIVEGGPKGIKRYARLLLERLEPSDPSWSQLLWTGTQPTKSEQLTGGKPFQMKIVEKNFEAVEYLEKCGYKHFWPLANQNNEQ